MYDSDLSEFGSTSYEGLDCRYMFMLQLPQYTTVRSWPTSASDDVDTDAITALDNHLGSYLIPSK